MRGSTFYTSSVGISMVYSIVIVYRLAITTTIAFSYERTYLTWPTTISSNNKTCSRFLKKYCMCIIVNNRISFDQYKGVYRKFDSIYTKYNNNSKIKNLMNI